MSEIQYQEIFEHGEDQTNYRKLTSDHVSTTQLEGREILKIDPQALTLLAREALDDVSHLLRSSHLRQLAKILDDPESSDNDRFVALELLKKRQHRSRPGLTGLSGHRYSHCHRIQGGKRLHLLKRCRGSFQRHRTGLR